MWMKMMAFGATASILALGACTSSEGESAEDMDSTAREDGTGEAPLAVEGQFCGGIAGLACPIGYTCADNPLDGCDPARGGADCGGVCVAEREARVERRPNPSACRRHDPNKSYYISRSPDECAAIDFICEEGREFFDKCGCGCEKVVGTPCGNNVCGAGESCCNASCGWCVPEGMMCIQIACEQPLSAQ
jgi:hypothetical protein